MTAIGHAELIGTFRQDSPEWHQARAELIGGSDIASVLGLSSWKSAYTLWMEKAGKIQPAERDERTNRKLAYGHHMEPFVADEFKARHPELSVYETGTWRNRERPWQGCNPDRLLVLGDRPVVDAHSLLQIKTANFAADWEDGIPPGYLAQVLWEMDTFGFHSGYLAVYFNVTGDYVEYPVTLDQFQAEAVRVRARAFADSITDGEIPEIDGSDSTFQTLRRLNPSLDKGRKVEIPEEIGVEYLEAAANVKWHQADLTKWKGHLLAHMGTAQYALHQGKQIASRVAVKDGVPYLKET